MTTPSGLPACGRIRVNEVESIAVGTQTVPYVCARAATVTVLDEYDDEHLLCPECATEVTAAADAARLRRWGDTVRVWARGMGHRPAVAGWLTAWATAIDHTAQALEEEATS